MLPPPHRGQAATQSPNGQHRTPAGDLDCGPGRHPHLINPSASLRPMKRVKTTPQQARAAGWTQGDSCDRTSQPAGCHSTTGSRPRTRAEGTLPAAAHVALGTQEGTALPELVPGSSAEPPPPGAQFKDLEHLWSLVSCVVRRSEASEEARRKTCLPSPGFALGHSLALPCVRRVINRGHRKRWGRSTPGAEKHGALSRGRPARWAPAPQSRPRRGPSPGRPARLRR